ncbi:hypothetical protein ACQR1N_33070, partial [Bradyrhizobium sp. HKCCYLRH1073]|uniref:hypothetical protein n=1 Tax=unclassified Bradyrhizobium TaxID=2631580 RepID=UPI0029163D6B
ATALFGSARPGGFAPPSYTTSGDTTLSTRFSTYRQSPMKPKDETCYIPMGVAEKKSRLERFADLNRWVTARGGWIVSLPGADPVIVECLPGSFLVDALTEAGHEVSPAGEGERIIPGQIVQRFVRASDGAFEPLTLGSTKTMAMTVTNAGVTRVMRYNFNLV